MTANPTIAKTTTPAKFQAKRGGLSSASVTEGCLSLLLPAKLLIYKHSQIALFNKVLALSFAERDVLDKKDSFIWMLGKNRFIRVAASVALDWFSGDGFGRSGVSSYLRKA